MYAVVKTGGKQYRVAVGDKLKVEKIIAEEGDTINLEQVLMVNDGEQIRLAAASMDTTVAAKVLSHGRGKKIRIFKMKRRKDYRRTQGHRQAFTEIEITSIDGGPATQIPAEINDQTTKAPITETGSDSLTEINGIGPVIEEKLVALGITTFKQIATLDQGGIDTINQQLSFKEQIEREQWVEQAKQLIAAT